LPCFTWYRCIRFCEGYMSLNAVYFVGDLFIIHPNRL
jgi:hypothetical protein